MPLDIENGVIELAHGSGGKATQDLLDQLIFPILSNPALNKANDQALLNIASDRVVVATDSHVVSPLFFPGGDIGSLSVHGTINDIAVAGAKPVALTAGLIIEEGFALKDLRLILESMSAAASQSGVSIVSGDTKVVERGAADGLYINTTGIGAIEHNAELGIDKIRVGDQVILSGSLANHGMTIMAERESLPVHGPLSSDTAALDGLISNLLPHIDGVHCMRDPTRGGLAACLNEFASGANVGFQIQESRIALEPAVLALTELLGVDPFYMANEGSVVIVCAPSVVNDVLNALKQHPLGKDAQIIGEVVEDNRNLVELNTRFGGRRLLDWRYSDPLPRIC